MRTIRSLLLAIFSLSIPCQATVIVKNGLVYIVSEGTVETTPITLADLADSVIIEEGATGEWVLDSRAFSRREYFLLRSCASRN